MDKPAGMTSHDVVQQVRRALKTRAAGHTGTLDPFATGLLIVLLGRATRLARFVEAQPKTYLATARLGIRTSTDDLTGQVVETSDSSVSEHQVCQTLASFQGSFLQRPPPYSAKRVAGERSYLRARRGEAVELAEVPVTVYEIELIAYRPPELDFRVTVSPGTYVRAIARDLGDGLGVGAHLTRLRRESIGSLTVDRAIPLHRLSPAAVVPPRDILCDLPTVELEQPERQAVAHGRAVIDGREVGQRGSGEVVALLGQGEVVAIARAEDGWLRPTVVLDPA